jgi:hypothetical protein
LCWAGFRAGYADAGVVSSKTSVKRVAAPYLPYGHPDLLLARAVAIQVNQDEADLIIASRLEYRLIEQIAAAAGTDLAGLRMRRKRAETRAADATVDGLS